MLMAAGLGTRLKPFTDVLPKPMLPLMGVPMAQYAFDAMERAGVGRVVANVHLQAERMKGLLAGLERGSMELSVSDESALLLGSGGGIRQALPLLGKAPFYLMNADTLCDINLAALMDRHLDLRKKHGTTLTLAVFRKAPGAGSYSEIQLDASGERVTGLGGKAQGKPFFVGVAVIEPEAVAHLPAGKASEFVPMILQPAIAAGKAGAFITSGLWYDVGSPRLWLETHLELIEGLDRPEFPAAWRERFEKCTRLARSGVWVDRGFEVGGTMLQGPAFLGPGVQGSASVGPRAVVYGPAPSPARDGIGFGGHWVAVPPAPSGEG